MTANASTILLPHALGYLSPEQFEHQFRLDNVCSTQQGKAR